MSYCHILLLLNSLRRVLARRKYPWGTKIRLDYERNHCIKNEGIYLVEYYIGDEEGKVIKK
jgi:hypothetical protein